VNRLLAVGLVALVGLGLSSGTKTMPTRPPHADEMPPAAVGAKDGYLKYTDDTALDGFAEAWFSRFPPAADGPVVVDRRHSTTQGGDRVLGLNSTAYGDMHVYGRAFEALERQGVELVEHRDVLTPGALSGTAGVFINLMSGGSMPLEGSEVATLSAYLEAGGALVLITDHTNAYLHQDMLSGLSRELGFRLPPVTNADRGRGHTLSPSSFAWVRIRPLQDHPINRGVRVGGMLTGGVIEGWDAVVGTSERSWQDAWNPEANNTGFTGELRWQEGESRGANAAVAVRSIGQGRAVVLADQNAWGAVMLGYEDNGRIWQNAWSWALDRPFETLDDDLVTVLAGPRSLCTSAAAYGFHTLQVHAARLGQLTGHREVCTAFGPRGRNVLMLPEYEGPLPTDINRGVAVLDAQSEGAQRLMQSLSVGWRPAEEPVTGPLTWRDPLPDLAGRELSGPVESNPISLVGDVEVLAVDSLDRPVVVRLNDWVLVLDASLLKNGALGRQDVRLAEHAGTVDLATRLLGWLFTPPSH
jgi:hypothetical protein